MSAGLAVADRPLVFVTVGTDHHPFDRLVTWVDDWFVDRGAHVARGMIQVGTSRPPRSVDWRPYLAPDELHATLDRAAVVVCHGGPGTVMDCRNHGFRPIVVPRRDEFGEHVDDHQVRFARWLSTDPAVEVVDDGEERFRAALDLAVADPAASRAIARIADVRVSVARFEQLVLDLFGAPYAEAG